VRPRQQSEVSARSGRYDPPGLLVGARALDAIPAAVFASAGAWLTATALEKRAAKAVHRGPGPLAKALSAIERFHQSVVPRLADL
jgi:hypothetical protein